MTALGEADRLVQTARRRLVGAARLRAATSGLAVGALVSICAWGALLALGLTPATLVLVALPVFGGVFNAVADRSTRISRERAALTLDRAAGTDEAFVSALTANDAAPSFRELAAHYALGRCDASRLARVLPFDVPRAAPTAALSAALLAALLIVPQAGAEPDAPRDTSTDGTQVAVQPNGGVPAPSANASLDPERRAEALIAALTAPPATSQPAEIEAAALRRALPALDADALAAIAQALADGDLGARSEAAQKALAALRKGDLAAAERALDDALSGARTRPVAGFGNAGSLGSGEPESSGPATRSVPAGSAPTWPLRYDRTVRRWFEATSGSNTRKNGPLDGPGDDR